MNDRYQKYRQQWYKAGDEGIITNYPTHVDLELSSACDSRCPFCPVTPNYADMPEVRHLKRQSIFPIGFMPTELFHKIVDEISGRVKSIKLNWRGEATLHPKFDELVTTIMKKDFVEVFINTHGNYPEKKRNSVHKLDKVIFSIDSIKRKTYESIRRNLSFDLLMENLAYAVDHMKKTGKPHIRINQTITKDNQSEVEKIKLLFGNLDKRIEVRQAPVFDRTPDQAQGYSLGLKIIGRRNCKYPWQRLMVAWNGKCAPCCVKWDLEKSDLIVGDAHKQTIKEIWHAKMINMVRRDAKEANYTLSSCISCQSWASYKVADESALLNWF